MPHAHLVAAPHWVYRMFDEHGSLLYIGMTSNPESRMAGWASHARNSARHEWVQGVARMGWRRYPDHASARAAEVSAIRSEFPAHNIQGTMTPTGFTIWSAHQVAA